MFFNVLQIKQCCIKVLKEVTLNPNHFVRAHANWNKHQLRKFIFTSEPRIKLWKPSDIIMIQMVRTMVSSS